LAHRWNSFRPSAIRILRISKSKKLKDRLIQVSHQVVNPPPKQQGSVLGQIVAGETRLGQVLYWIAFSLANARLLASVRAELATLRKQHHTERVHKFLALRAEAAKRCAEAALGTPYPEGHASTPEVAPRIKYRAAHHTCDVTRSKESPIEPVASPYNEAWNVLRQKALQERYNGHLNFCPRCWVARVQGVVIPKERACLDCIGLKKLDEAEATKAAKRARTLAEYCAEFKKDNSAKLAAKGWVGYSPEDYDRDILKSRGSVMDDVVHQFEKSHSRRLNKWRLR
jgi:hypothetical protein